MESQAATIWDLVVQGIPDGIRVDVWLALSGVDEIRARILEKSKLTGKEYYNSLVARAERELSEQLQDQIDRDLPRTFPKLKSTFNTKAGQPVRGVRARSARIFNHFKLLCFNYVRRISLAHSYRKKITLKNATRIQTQL
jgi:hypothetical protein